MYDELVNRLRNGLSCYGEKCLSCPDRKHCVTHYEHEAADAIEELQGRVKTLIRKLDEANQDADYANEAAKALYGALPRWIPVTEQLPVGGDDSGAICENVCLLMDDGTVSCGWMNGITKKVYYLNARDDVVIKAPITRVTHWMPLPEPPKEG